MNRLAVCLACLLGPAPLLAQTPDFAGSFSAEGEYGMVVVSLQPTERGYAGTMSSGTVTWRLQGEVYEGALTGTIDTGQGMLAFEAHVVDDVLRVIIVEIGPDGAPLTDQGQELSFARTGDDAQPASPSLAALAGGSNAAGGADPFLGSFTDGQFTLSLQGTDGGYSGSLAVGAEAFPVSAQRDGNRIAGTMNAPTGQYAFTVTPSAGGVVLSNGGTDYVLRRVAGMADRGVESSASTPPQAGNGTAQVDNSPLAQQWRAHLAGRKVTYMDSYSSNTAGGGGFSTKFVYHLCSNGQFGYSGSDVVSHNIGGTGVDGGGTAGSSSGTWRIMTQGQLAGIELRFGNGRTEVYRLDMQGDQTYANGDRVYVTAGEMCR